MITIPFPVQKSHLNGTVGNNTTRTPHDLPPLTYADEPEQAEDRRTASDQFSVALYAKRGAFSDTKGLRRAGGNWEATYPVLALI